MDALELCELWNPQVLHVPIAQALFSGLEQERQLPAPGTLARPGFPEAFCSGSPLSPFSRTSAPPRSDCANETVEELPAAPLPMLPLQAAAYTRGVITEGDGGCWHLPPT